MFSANFFIFLAAVAVCFGAPKAKFSSKHLKIDGGADAKVEDYPFVASVQFCVFGNICEHVCGGVIIADTWILTGSSCVAEASKVTVGASDLHGDDKVTVDVKAAYRHPDFPADGIGPNDVGLLQLAEPLKFNDKVQAAKLPTQGQEFNGTAVVTGYGSSLLPDFNRLQAAIDVALISNDECNRAIRQILKDQDSPLDDGSNICTLNKASNNCDGDIGGPLSQNGTVIGTITWFIDPCGSSGAPNIFTKLSNFANFINQTITAYS